MPHPRSLRLWIAPALALPLALAPGCSGTSPGPRNAVQFPAWEEEVEDFSAWLDPLPAPDPGPVRLERVTTAVPWPRGLALVDGELVVLARGRHRRAGGVDPAVADQAGTLFAVDPQISEPVEPGRAAGEAVKGNARPLAGPVQGPFHLFDPDAGPPADDVLMDRPYCTLRFDPVSQNLFICGFSGVDLAQAEFRKNATDSIHRFDLRTMRWYAVEMHDASVVPLAALSSTVSNEYYPHHDPRANPAPHGWLNGGDGALVAGRYLYAVAKDNHLLVQYDLDRIRADPDAGPPASRAVLGSAIDVRLCGEVRTIAAFGHSALAEHDGYLYVGFRTSSIVLRFALDETGDLARPAVGELIAVFDPYRPGAKSANLVDLAFDRSGALHASCATAGVVWRIGRPDPARVFNGMLAGEHASANRPYVSLAELCGTPKASTGNILFDEQDRLYVCSGNYDSGTDLAGVIYRAVPAER